MEKSIILLVSFDEEYVTSVEGFLSKKLLESFKLEFITQMDYLVEYLKTPHKIDVLIIEEKLIDYFVHNQVVYRKLVITDTDKIGVDLINKYAGAQGIIKILGSQYLSVDAGGERTRTSIIDVISVGEPDVKTTAALAISSHLSSLGKKVLYLCAENLQNFNSILFGESEVNKSCEDQALAITSIVNGDMSKIDGLFAEAGFDLVPQFDRFLSSYGLSPENIFTLADVISKIEIYDVIVIEHPYGLPSSSISRMEKSKKVVILSGQDRDSCRKLSILFDNTRGVYENCVITCYPYDKDSTYHLDSVDTDNSLVCERIGELKTVALNKLIEKRVFRNTVEAVL